LRGVNFQGNLRTNSVAGEAMSKHQSPNCDDRIINFIYRLLFDRDADPSAVEHWRTYLAKGLPDFDLFLSLWNSAEFSAKSEQSRYVTPPRQQETQSARGSEFITDKFFRDIVDRLDRDRLSLLEIKAIRGLVAQWRYRDLMQTRGIKSIESAEAYPDTVAYNELTLKSYVDLDRSSDMIRPLLSIDRVARNVASLKVLAVGPRTENEIFALLAAGFSLGNISAIDLFSYSPLIQAGDMHHMEFSDDTFDIVAFGETLAYSKEPAVAAKEIVRVAKNNSIVTIVHAAVKGHSPLLDREKPHVATQTGLFVHSTEDIIHFFRPNVGHVYLRCEPEADGLNRIVTMFDVVKSA